MAEFRHIGEVKLRIDALHVHVHADRDNIHVSGSLAVSEQRSLDTVCSGKDTHLCIGNAAAAVIVRMKGKNDIIAVSGFCSCIPPGLHKRAAWKAPRCSAG